MIENLGVEQKIGDRFYTRDATDHSPKVFISQLVNTVQSTFEPGATQSPTPTQIFAQSPSKEKNMNGLYGLLLLLLIIPLVASLVYMERGVRRNRPESSEDELKSLADITPRGSSTQSEEFEEAELGLSQRWNIEEEESVEESFDEDDSTWEVESKDEIEDINDSENLKGNSDEEDTEDEEAAEVLDEEKLDSEYLDDVGLGKDHGTTEDSDVEGFNDCTEFAAEEKNKDLDACSSKEDDECGWDDKINDSKNDRDDGGTDGFSGMVADKGDDTERENSFDDAVGHEESDAYDNDTDTDDEKDFRETEGKVFETENDFDDAIGNDEESGADDNDTDTFGIQTNDDKEELSDTENDFKVKDAVSDESDDGEGNDDDWSDEIDDVVDDK